MKDMQRCEFKGKPAEGECDRYTESDVKRHCLYFAKDFWADNGGGSICTAPPKEKK